MKTLNKFPVVLIAAVVMVSSTAVFAQTPDTTTKTRQRFATKNPEPTTTNASTGAAATNEATSAKEPGTKNLESVLVTGLADKREGDDGTPAAATLTATKPVDVPEDTQANRHEQPSEEAAVVPYYNNFFNTYRLGPEDIISVSVFGQDRYSRAGITVPPSGRISLALIP